MKERRKARLTWAKTRRDGPGYTQAVGIVQPVAVVHRDDPRPEDVVLVPVTPDAEPTTFSLFIEWPGANINGRLARQERRRHHLRRAHRVGW
jgi:hypothetical protein